jgi:N6-L-threonylcarbamoyladenine synthase
MLEVPPIALCTDNAAMIASAARYVQPIPYPDYLALDVFATGERALGAGARS